MTIKSKNNLEEIKNQIQDLILKNKEDSLKIDTQLQNALSTVQKEAIEKTWGMAKWFFSFLAIIVTFTAAIGFLGKNDLESYYKNYLEKKVRSWLVFSDERSTTFKTLDQIRLELLLARKNFLKKTNLKELEKIRLKLALMDPNTDLEDFIDIILIFEKDLSLLYSNSFVSEIFRTILPSKEYSTKKKLYLIKGFGISPDLIPYSIEVLTSKKYHSNIKSIAFDSLFRQETQFLLKYSRNNINRLKFNFEDIFFSPEFEFTLKQAIYLATKRPNDSELKTFIERVIQEKPSLPGISGDRVLIKIVLAMLKKNSDTRVTKSVNLLNVLIRNDFHFLPRPDLGINMKPYEKIINYYPNNAKLILTNKDLINNLFTLNADHITNLKKAVRFFQITEKNGLYATTVHLILEGNSTITLTDKSQLSANSTNFPVWLSVKKYFEKTMLYASWMDKLGNINKKQVQAVNSLEKSNFQVNYNNDVFDIISILKDLNK